MFETRSLKLNVCGIDWPLKPRCRRYAPRFSAAFGPDEIAIMVAAYEVGLAQINVSGHNETTAETLAQIVSVDWLHARTNMAFVHGCACG